MGWPGLNVVPKYLQRIRTNDVTAGRREPAQYAESPLIRPAADRQGTPGFPSHAPIGQQELHRPGHDPLPSTARELPDGLLAAAYAQRTLSLPAGRSGSSSFRRSPESL